MVRHQCDERRKCQVRDVDNGCCSVRDIVWYVTITWNSAFSRVYLPNPVITNWFPLDNYYRKYPKKTASWRFWVVLLFGNQGNRVIRFIDNTCIPTARPGESLKSPYNHKLQVFLPSQAYIRYCTSHWLIEEFATRPAPRIRMTTSKVSQML